ncbi:MAG: sugar-specific transcriptional regulator TrmB [Oceanicoccus sp.]|jgi:sugar-specific transcriptional regulator TrmB
MISKQLTKLLGLNEKDAKIYLDLLRFGSSAASSTATRTQIDRTTVYAALKRLIRKGLVSQTKRDGTTFFASLDPDALEVSIQRDIQEKQTKLNVLKALLPDLEALKNTESVRPAVQIFEGVDGVIALYELMLKENDELSAFLTVAHLPKELKSYLTDTYIKRKIKRGVHSRVLVSDSKRAKRYQELDPKGNRTTKITPEGSLPFETEIIIGTDGVAMIDLQDQFFGVFIKSPSIRNTLNSIFELVWGLID